MERLKQHLTAAREAQLVLEWVDLAVYLTFHGIDKCYYYAQVGIRLINLYYGSIMSFHVSS